MAVISEITEHTENQRVKRRGSASGEHSRSFASDITLEQADILLKNTGQYTRWIQLNQNKTIDTHDLANVVIDRHKLVTLWQSTGQIDPAEFDKLTDQLRQAGIRLYTSTQLQRKSPPDTKNTHNQQLTTKTTLDNADRLLQSTHQYNKWHRLRQNNDSNTDDLANIVVDRHKLVTAWKNTGQIDPIEFDKLTNQLRQADINLYTSTELQQKSTPYTENTLDNADRLLKNTHQYTKWRHIRQNNDEEAQRLAHILLERLSILQAIESNKPVDHIKFDQLTNQLSQAGIHLSSYKQLHQESVQPTDTTDIPKKPPTLPTTVSGLPATPQRPKPALASFEGTNTAPIEKNLAATMPATSIPATASADSSLLNEENVLILNMLSKQFPLNQTVFAYGNEKTVLVPLNTIARALDFNIQVNQNKGTAEGWYIDPQRTFSLDTSKKSVVVDNMRIPWNEGSVVRAEDDIYIDIKEFSSWFPVDFDLSRSELTLGVIPREKLPYQLMMERERQHLGLSDPNSIPLKYPVKDLKYDLFSMPVMDVTLHGGHGNKNLESADLQGQYSLLARGDLAYMNSYIFASGIEDSPLDTARIRLERVDPKGNFLGPLQANQVAVGDILPATFPILPNGTPERGLFISNADLNRSVSYDSTRFEGNLTPGWQVELHQNGAFIQGKSIGANGRYLFDDVPVYYGTNDFEVLAYGPQGQKQVVEEKQLTIGTGMLPQGDGIYQFSASQYEQTILGVDEADSPVDNDRPRITGRYQYGLTDNLSAGLGLSSLEFSEERHNYIQAGISGNALSSYGEIDFLQDTAGGSGLSLFAQTTLGSVNINAKQEFFSDFVMENRPEATLESKTEVKLNGNLPSSPIIPAVSYTLSSQNLKYSDDQSANLSARLSGKFSNIYLSNYTAWNYEKQFNDAPDVEGLFQVSGDIGPVRTTGDIKYELGDESNISRFSLSGQWQMEQNLRAGFELTQEPVYDDRTTASAKIDWDSGTALVSPSLSYDSEGNLGAFLTLSFSLGRDSAASRWDMSSDHRAAKGNVSSLVYHDSNNNKQFDAGDTPLPDVKVKAVQSWGESETDASGRGLMSGLQPYKPTDIEIDEESLEDPFMMPSTKGSAILPRPGHFNQMEFPIVSTGEIDGTVYFVDKDGTSAGHANIKLELVDSQQEIVREIHTEYDGFYLFEKVLPGNYNLRVSPEDMDKVFLAENHQITIGNDGTIVSGKDIVLQNKEKNIDKPFPSSSTSEIKSAHARHISIEAEKILKKHVVSDVSPYNPPPVTAKPLEEAFAARQQDLETTTKMSLTTQIATEDSKEKATYRDHGQSLQPEQAPLFSTFESVEKGERNEQRIQPIFQKPIFPVVEYSLEQKETIMPTDSISDNSPARYKQELGFNAIPSPITPFSPIDESTLKAVRTIYSAPETIQPPALTKSSGSQFHGNTYSKQAVSNTMTRRFHITG